MQVAYKNAIGQKRIAWRVIDKTSQVPKYMKRFPKEVSAYKKRLEEEIVDLCKDVLNLVSKFLMPRA